MDAVPRSEGVSERPRAGFLLAGQVRDFSCGMDTKDYVDTSQMLSVSYDLLVTMATHQAVWRQLT